MESPLLTAEDVAKQLNIKKYTVYELIKRNELPSSKVGKQVRVSQADIQRYLESRKTGVLPPAAVRPGRSAQVCTDQSGAQALGPPILCGQDVCLELLVSRAAETGRVQVLRSYMGSYNGLYAFYNRRVSMTAAHLWDAETDTYNYPFIRRLLPGVSVGALRLAGRLEGLYVRKGNPLGIRGWQDFARSDLGMVNRERGSGVRILLDQKLKLLGLDAAKMRGYDRECTSHRACAGAVSKGSADVACGCEQGAVETGGVDFIPLQLEWYDLVFRLEDRDSPVMQAILSYVSSAAFKQDLEITGKYDISQTGHCEFF
ncbi:MAG: helix-turn-helix transcriptional regulator [Spirochaetaceae bacterium]|jgi:putative molybdopterin biosynthesis protein|nr:helix-turn-helix transcriptional regulator [Spirochaetaceae bacterium]